MILEEVLGHPTRDDIYVNQIITPHTEVRESDKKIINRILLKEITRESIDLTN